MFNHKYNEARFVPDSVLDMNYLTCTVINLNSLVVIDTYFSILLGMIVISDKSSVCSARAWIMR